MHWVVSKALPCPAGTTIICIHVRNTRNTCNHPEATRSEPDRFQWSSCVPVTGLRWGHRIPRSGKLKVTRCNPHVKTKEKREEGRRGPPSKEGETYLSENCYQKPSHTLQCTTYTEVSLVAWACCCFPPRCNCSSDSQKSLSSFPLNQEP